MVEDVQKRQMYCTMISRLVPSPARMSQSTAASPAMVPSPFCVRSDLLSLITVAVDLDCGRVL